MISLRAWFPALACGLALLAVPLHAARAEPIPLEARESVGYVLLRLPKWNPAARDFFKNADGTPVLEMTHVGTAFTAQYTWDGGETRAFVVTAKHVVFDLRSNRLRGPVFLRWMSDQKRPEVFALGDTPWLTHPDPGVDLAVLRGVPRKASTRTVQSELWLTDELIQERGIDLGDEVFYTGLLYQLPGQTAIAPIVRFGRLALVTSERLVSPDVPQGSLLHFIDAANMAGHSGSPVFLWATPTRNSSAIVIGERIFRLYGVVSNVLTYPIPLQETAAPRASVPSSGGVTGVVPVRYLREILESEAGRRAFEIGKRKVKSPGSSG